MPRITVRRHGASASIPHVGVHNGTLQSDPTRTANRGWTPAVARRNAQFLQRVDFGMMEGIPYALTLTLPAKSMERVTPDLLHRLIDVMLKYLARRGMKHFHWVIEFTAKHMPHVHMTVWMSDTHQRWNPKTHQHETVDNDLVTVTGIVVGKWLDVTADCGIHTSGQSQDVQLLDGNAAWLSYVAKHTQRGVWHYQRALENMPSTWKENPGAMWGHSRKIPLTEDSVLPADLHAFHQFRRETRKWCCSQASRIADPKRRATAIQQARRMNRCPIRELSVVRPISIWIPRTVSAAIIRGLRSRGYMIGRDVYEWVISEMDRLRATGDDPDRMRALQRTFAEMMRGVNIMAIVIPEIPLKDKLTLTVPEASALSGIPYKIVNAAVKNGNLAACYAGSSTVRIRRSDLDDWVAALPSDWC